MFGLRKSKIPKLAVGANRDRQHHGACSNCGILKDTCVKILRRHCGFGGSVREPGRVPCQGGRVPV